MAEPPDDLHHANGVLRNKLGVTDRTTLQDAERVLVGARDVELRIAYVLTGRFDYPRLKATHRYLFQDVYNWAGQPRNWDIAKRAPDGVLSHFIAGDDVEATALQLFGDLERDDYLDGYAEDTPAILARMYSNINVLHPFPDGNGRTNRLFVQQLAEERGYPLTFDTADRGELLGATVEASRGNTRLLERLFQEAARRSAER